MTDAIIGAFLMEGLQDACYADVLAQAQDRGMGAIELVAHLAEYAPAIAVLECLPDEHPGVFHYDVTSAFGHWFGRRLVTDDLPTKNKAAETLAALAYSFFSRNDLCPTLADLRRLIDEAIQ